MKIDFTYENPTKIYFGKTAMCGLAVELKKYGPTVLLVYGKNAIKRMGIYDQIMDICKECGKTVYELSGVMPNPTYAKVLEGRDIAREHHVDLILAVGGGSTIDCAKAISTTATCTGDAWTKYWINKEDLENPPIPVGSILTMAGTGSEMNSGTVITHEETKIKKGRTYPVIVNPRFSILNPEFTYSVPHYQMVSGIYDMMSHLMENYFAGSDDSVSNYIIEGILRSIISSARVAVKNPQDYEARANLMWSATLAMNPIVGLGKDHDFEVHMIEHQLGAYSDCAHGMGLAAISLPYYRYMCSHAPAKFARFAKEVWGVSQEGASEMELGLAGIDAMERFMAECGMETKLRNLNATEEMLPLIANSTVLGGGYKKLTADEVLDILKAAY